MISPLLTKTFYLWAVLLIAPLWLAVFMARKRSRRDMLLSGIFFGLGAVLIAKFYALADYWHPPYVFGRAFNFEDFLYGFFWGGLASELFEFVFGFEDSDRRLRCRYDLLAAFFLMAAAAFPFFVNFLGFNSIVAHIIPPLIVGFYVILMRKDLWRSTILGGFCSLVFTTIGFQLILFIYPPAIAEFWKLDKLSGLFLLGVPLEEYLFAFALGFGASSYYELVMGRTLRRYRG